jgi:hypothetical protein
VPAIIDLLEAQAYFKKTLTLKIKKIKNWIF